MTSVDLPDVLPRAALRPARLGALRGGGRGGDPVARLLVVDRRGDARLPVCGALLLPDREGVRRAKPRGGSVGAIAASLVAPFVRGELVVIPIVLAIAHALRSVVERAGDGAAARRGRWDDYLGVIRARARRDLRDQRARSHHSQQWYGVTTYWKHRAIVLGDWAAGALAIGIGVIPFVVGLAALFAVRGEDRGRASCGCSGPSPPAAIIGFGLYTGMKAAYLQSVVRDARRGAEPHLHRAAPLHRHGARPRAAPRQPRRARGRRSVRASTSSSARRSRWACSSTRTRSASRSCSRRTATTSGRRRTAQWLLVGITRRRGRARGRARRAPRATRRLATALAAALAVGILAWNVTGEISAAAGDDLDRREHRRDTPPSVHLGRRRRAAASRRSTSARASPTRRPEWLLEFWNRSIVTVNSLDSSLVGPGPSGTPNIAADGRIYWSLTPDDPGRVYDYAVEDWPCVDLAGTVAATARLPGRRRRRLREWRLIQLTKPNRLRAACSGIYPDGWTGAERQHVLPLRRTPSHGWLRIRISRQNWPASPVHIQFGSIRTKYQQPVVGRIFRERRFDVAHAADEGHLAAHARRPVRRARRRRQEVRPARARSRGASDPRDARRAGRLPLLQEAPARREAAIIRR